MADAAPHPEDSGELSQADIDAAFGSPGAEPAPAAEESAGFSQADIDAAFNAAAAAAGIPAEAPAAEADIDAVLAEEAAESAPDTRVDATGRPFDAAAAAMAAAIAEEQHAAAQAPPPPQTGAVNLPDFTHEADEPETRDRGLALIQDVELKVKIELGRTRMLVEDVLTLGEGSVVELDKLAGDPVDVFVNERLVARGEVLVLNDSFCVRISEIVSSADARQVG
jgi:flagellar motor switch protein FliN